MEEKKDQMIADKEPEDGTPITPKLGADVYENSSKFNLRLATIGPSILYALSKVNEHLKFPNVATAAGGMVIGAVGFFGNKFFRRKGDDSAYTYMGMIFGGVQFTAGFFLLALQASEVYADNGDSGKLINVIKLAGAALVVTETTLVLMNSYLYSDGAPKADSGMRRKMD